MVSLTIDDIEVKAWERETILDAARKAPGAGRIPTLCHSENMPSIRPKRSCRVCTVEMVRDGRSRHGLACVTPVREGMEVYTNSEKAIEERKKAVSELLARCSKVKAVLDLAEELGVSPPEGASEEECILCGMCQSVCEAGFGIREENAISLIRTDNTSYYDVNPGVCLGCGDCVVACPLNSIELLETAVIPEPKSLAK